MGPSSSSFVVVVVVVVVHQSRSFSLESTSHGKMMALRSLNDNDKAVARDCRYGLNKQ
jgi:hypothetical protein